MSKFQIRLTGRREGKTAEMVRGLPLNAVVVVIGSDSAETLREVAANLGRNDVRLIPEYQMHKAGRA